MKHNMRSPKKIILVMVLLLGLFWFWYEKHYLEQEIPIYSLKCSHIEYREVIRWFLLKRKRKNDIPSGIFDGPWSSKEFSLSSDKNQLEETGALTLATKDTFKFSSRLHSEKEIYINRQNLRLKPENESQYTYSCEIRNPGEFWQYVEQKLDIEKSRLKI